MTSTEIKEKGYKINSNKIKRNKQTNYKTKKKNSPNAPVHHLVAAHPINSEQ